MGNARIAVIEDDDSMRSALHRLLTAAGFIVAGYPSAEVFLLSPQNLGVDCLVCDQNLPDMSGLALLDVLKASNTSVAVILITAFDKPGLRQLAVDRGAIAYLTKPFPGTVLIAAVTAAIALSGNDNVPYGQ